VNLAVGLEGGGSGRQGGSTFKPFVLAAAIEDGVSVDSYVPGYSPRDVEYDEGTIEVHNYGETQYGTLSVTDATVRSVNTAYAQIGSRVGLKRIIDEAHKLGIRNDLPQSPRVVLGLAEVSVLDMASAYCTFANRGEYVEPRVVTKVVRPDGNTIEDFTPKKKPVTKENEADQVNWVLKQVIRRGTGTRAGIGRPAAGKTGTHDENTNAWFVGYTPEQLCSAVWMGYPESNSRAMNSVHGIRVDGGTLPAQIWGAFMAGAVDPMPVTKFVDPDFTGKVEAIGGARRSRSVPVSDDARAADDTTTSSTGPTSSTDAAGATLPADETTSSTLPSGATSPSTAPASTAPAPSTTSTTLLPLPTSPGT